MAPLFSLFNLYFCPRAWRILRLLPFPSLCTHGAFIFPVQSIFLSPGLEDPPASFFIYLWRIYISYRNHVALSGFISPRLRPFPFRVYVTVSPWPYPNPTPTQKSHWCRRIYKSLPLEGKVPAKRGMRCKEPLEANDNSALFINVPPYPSLCLSTVRREAYKTI